MEERIRQRLLKHCEEGGYNQDDCGIYEMLCDAKNIYEEKIGSFRHWDEHRHTVELGDMLIGYVDEYATGDMAGELGFEFDPNTICEMVPVEKTIVVYVPVGE